jgi:lipopolysaccharide biosynthesis protein
MGQDFKIGVVAHFFYAQQAQEIVGLLKNIPFKFDLYVSSSSIAYKEIQSFLAEAFPDQQMTIRIVENRGFDIAPFVCEFKDYYAAYDLVLKIHTKKSLHAQWLRDWGEYLLKNLVGSTDTVQSIIKMFQDDEKLGIVYPEIIPPFKESLIRDPWQENWTLCCDLSSRLGLSIRKNQQPDFPAGSMFWFRPKSLEPLFKLGLSASDFPGERRIRRNRTLAHAIERLFVLIAQKQGFSSRQVCFIPCVYDFNNRSFFQKAKRKLYRAKSALMEFFGFYR